MPIRTLAIRRAHENIDRILKAAKIDLFFCEAEAKILKGPNEDLESYLDAIEQLRSNIVFFFTNNGSFRSSYGVIHFCYWEAHSETAVLPIASLEDFHPYVRSCD